MNIFIKISSLATIPVAVIGVFFAFYLMILPAAPAEAVAIPVVPTCFFSPAAYTINDGDSATLSWTSNNAVSAVIDNGVGSVSTSGNTSVSPSVDTVYTMTVTSSTGHSSVCIGTVIVDPIVRACEITISEDTVNFGESVTVYWNTSGYDEITVGGETVAASGQKTYTNIQVDTLYQLHAETADGNHTCNQSVSVTCLIPDIACTLSGTPSNIIAGESAVITWTTTNADVATIDRGIGTVALDGSTTVSPTNDTTYTLTATGNGQTVQCPFTIEVDHPIPDPVCAFAIDPSTITSGDSATVIWTTENAASASIDQGIGVVALNGGGSVSPTSDTTYTLTVVGINGNTVMCQDSVTVLPKPDPVCSISADPISIKSGESSVITWTTAHADTVTIDQGIGAVADSGNTTVSPTDTTTYTLTATGNGTTVHCPVTVEVTDNPVLACSISADPISIIAGESSKITWSSVAATTAVIDRGIGSVDLNGDIDVSPIDDTTYTLTVGDALGNTVQCPVSIVVIPKTVTQCTMTGDPLTISTGESAVLTWTTDDAIDVVIDQGIGAVADDGTTTVSPTQTTTYTLSATGKYNDAYCPVTITVTDDPAPVCEYFTVDPTTLTGAGDVTLDWKVLNANTVTIDQSIGSVAIEGTTTATVSQSTTFTLTATGAGGTVSCPATVTVNSNSSLSCDAFSASPTQVIPGGTTELEWQTTGATEVSINNGVGTVPVDGTQTINVDSDTTYTLTARDAQNNMVTCDVFVDTESGGGGGGSSSPSCDLDISDTKITAGEEVVITWDNARTNDMVLEDNRGNVLVDTTKSSEYDEDEGSITVTPTKDTEYTMTATRGSKDRVCRVEVEIEDSVTVIENRSQEPQVAGISLSQVPYTGFEAGPFLTIVFYTVLALWAGFIAYVLIVREQPVLGVTLGGDAQSNTTINEWEQMVDDLHAAEMPAEQEDSAPVVASATAVDAVPHNLPTGLPTEEPVVQHGYQSFAGDAEFEKSPLTALENVAHNHNTLLSSDALQFFADAYDSETEQTEALLATINAAKAKFPAEGGWLVLNRERVNQLQPAAVAAEVPQFTPEMRVGESSMAEAIVAGNAAAAQAMIGTRPMFSVADAVADFDAVHRARKGMPSNASELLLESTKSLSDAQIETIIAALTSALDGAYTDEAAAVKMAIMKAVQVVG